MQIRFDFPNQQITIDGQELELIELLKLVREIAPKIPTINIVSQTNESAPKFPPTPSVNGNGHSTMRQFVRSLQLDNMAERIAAIAYYHKTFGSKPNLTPKELADLFTQCGFQKPQQMAVSVFDAKRKYGFMESAGHGMWR